MSNHFKSLLEGGEPAIGTQLRSGNASIAELFGHAGYDFLIIDAEHGPQTQTGILSQLQAIAGTGATALVRVPVNDPTSFGTILDMGPGGILAPLVKSAAEVEAGAKACRYPPRGNRGYGPERAHRYGFDLDYFETANDNILYTIIVETAEAIDAIDEIMSVDGLDAYFLGAYDLSIALGVPLQFAHPTFLEAVEKVVQAATDAGVPLSTGVDPEEGAAGIKAAFDAGFRVILSKGDVWILETVTRGAISDFRQAKQT